MRLPINKYKNNLCSIFNTNSSENNTLISVFRESKPMGVNYYKLSNGESLGIPVLPTSYMFESYLDTLANDEEKKIAYQKWNSLRDTEEGKEFFSKNIDYYMNKDKDASLASYSRLLVPSSSTGASSGTMMVLNYDNISNIINKINASVEEVEANLRTVESNLISKINNSWASEAASQYTSKVVDSINRTKYIIETLKLLSQTYTKALNQSKNTQQDVSATVSNI